MLGAGLAGGRDGGRAERDGLGRWPTGQDAGEKVGHAWLWTGWGPGSAGQAWKGGRVRGRRAGIDGVREIEGKQVLVQLSVCT